jgi:hypothetical protein
MEDSHIPLNKWIYGFYLALSSKKGISSHQLHRTLGVSYKTAWFMSHRIREALRNGFLAPPMTGPISEADETFIGRKEGVAKGKHGYIEGKRLTYRRISGPRSEAGNEA